MLVASTGVMEEHNEYVRVKHTIASSTYAEFGVSSLFFADRTPGIRRSFFEARVAAEKDEIQRAGGAVALLGDDEFGLGAVFFRQVASCRSSAG